MTSGTFNMQTAPGYQILAVAGKQTLRPGGRSATEQLLVWADFQPGQTLLELASSFGHSAIDLARRFGVRVVGVEKNPASVERARANVRAAGLGHLVQIVEGDIFRLEAIDERFDYVLAEAILTMQPPAAKANILRAVANHLKPGGKFLSHEVAVGGREEEIHRELSRVIRVNAAPLSERGWIAESARADLRVSHHLTGPMALLTPAQVLRDEGIAGTARILWNVATRPALRERVLAMRGVFSRYRADLAYIVLCAVAG
ncbi:SAM-dependent methyltransferase [Gloeobacter violaceus]|uniref:Glr3652 protein n=1 Tax=Gloeobacter violaceus (strain ATCC 29082 / PCC 7421) TaxID=251221 RepID=Q7NF74_GLOVI|nr:class I SAM-dependent methyltransferase [Gloeobacter violaceus]BAC91593.1 glr3652 [Gloeobacter violaceus PCC 7421]